MYQNTVFFVYHYYIVNCKPETKPGQFTGTGQKVLLKSYQHENLH